MDKLSAMATFILVAEKGSFTKAAEMLHIPKSRVSQRITDLEDELGLRLMQRTTRSLNLTEDGAIYLKKIKHIISDIEEIENQFKGLTTLSQGNLYIESLTSIAKWIIAPKITDFQNKYPQISIHLGCSDRVSNILEEGIDCAIRGGKMHDSSLIAKHITDIKLGLYASPAYLAEIPNIVHPKELNHFHWISWLNRKYQDPLHWGLESDHERFEISNTRGLYFSDPEIAIDVCMSGRGICPAAPFAVESYVKAGKLKPVLMNWHFAPKAIHIVYPTKKHLSPKVRHFVDWLIHTLNEHSSLGLTPKELAQLMV
ncbi:LysR family transcriptional regulator [Acinetobacter guillouiae]|uniref:LysR family transcriptional regulator n=1 Tax=Acinetobacter guillouiae TaxID=106649 RepID=UPI0030087E73